MLDQEHKPFLEPRRNTLRFRSFREGLFAASLILTSLAGMYSGVRSYKLYEIVHDYTPISEHEQALKNFIKAEAAYHAGYSVLFTFLAGSSLALGRITRKDSEYASYRKKIGQENWKRDWRYWNSDDMAGLAPMLTSDRKGGVVDFCATRLPIEGSQPNKDTFSGINLN